jgi:hypothetical protein
MVSGGLDSSQKLIVYSKEKTQSRQTKSLMYSWLGHVKCMESERTIKCLLNNELMESAEEEDLGRGGFKM